MARFATLAVAALTGLLLGGCAGGNFAQAGLSLPAASGDGLQTVSDAADALDGHRSSGTADAKAAIAVTDALGSFVRDISADQRALAMVVQRHGIRPIHSIREYTVEVNGRRITAGSEIIMRSGQYCQSSAGYSGSGIPSLDASFGWQSGALSGGSRTTDARGGATWSARASGAVVQGAIGGLSIARRGAGSACPMSAPAFVLKGGAAENAFSLPLSMAFHRGDLTNLSVVNGRFANGENLEVTTRANRQRAEVDGAIANGRTQVATLRTNAAGYGTLTITSTGAQYVIADWIVVGT